MKKIVLILLVFYWQVGYGQEPKLILPIGHTSHIMSSLLTKDNKFLYTASWDKTIKKWDVKSGNLLKTLITEDYGFRDLVAGINGNYFISSSENGTVNVWDFNTDTLIKSIRAHLISTTDIILHPSGEYFLTSNFKDGDVKVWDTEEWKLVKKIKSGSKGIYNSSFSKSGKYLLCETIDRAIIIWDFQQDSIVKKISVNDYYITGSTFSPDEKSILLNLYDKVQLINIETGKIKFEITDHSKSILNCEFSPDGNSILTCSDDSTAKTWSSKEGSLIKIFNGHNKGVNKGRYFANGNYVITTSYDSTVKIWDFKGKLLNSMKHTSYARAIDVNSNENLILVTCSDNSSYLYSLKNGDLINKFNGHVNEVIMLDMDKKGENLIISSSDNSYRIWDFQKNNFIKIQSYDNRVYNYCKYSNDKEYVIGYSISHTVNYYDERLSAWNTETGHLIYSIKEALSYKHPLSFSNNGDFIISGSKDNKIRLWDIHTGLLLKTLYGHSGDIMSVMFSPNDSFVISSSADSTIKIWKAETGNIVKDFKTGDKYIDYAIFKPDGSQFVYENWNTIFFFDTKTWTQHKVLTAYTNDYIDYLQFNEDGNTLVTISGKKRVKLWLLGNDSCIKTFDVIGDSYACNFLTNKLVTQFNGVINYYNLLTGELLYTVLPIDNSDYLVTDSNGHYDGTPAARNLLYFTCGTEIIELDQLKDQLWVPNLAERIMKGETINAKKLSELNICGLTPEVDDKSNKADEYYFKIHPRRGGLGETILFVNGIEAKRYKFEELKKAGSDYELILKKETLQNFFVAGKENPVTIKAYTADNTISSRGIVIKEDKTKETSIPPNLYAVMVGVSDYKGDELDLKYAAKDAADVSGAVASAARKMLNTDGKEHVFMYNLTTAADRYLLPEKNSIKKILEEIGKKATANDILLIFFAGHGVMSGNEKKQFYFLTADASKASAVSATADVGISTTELIEWMKPQNISAQKRILIFDACNSGQAINDIAGKDLAVRNDDKAEQIKAIDKLNEKSGLFILSASASNQSAYEMGRYSQGLLTYALLKAIKQQPEILEDGKYLNVSRWFSAAEKAVSDLSKENGARQEPQIVTNTNFNIGVVDGEVIAKVTLPEEKPLFAASNFQNSDEAADGDNLDISKLMNLQLTELAARGTATSIVYAAVTNSPDAYSLSGRYDEKGSDVIIRVSIKKNNETKYRFEERGTKEKLKELVATIAAKASEWASSKTKINE